MKIIQLFGLIFFMFLSLLINGQVEISKTKDTNQVENIPKDKTSTQVTINLPDSIKIKNISENQEGQSSFEKKMPWIVALIIGLLSVLVNFWVAHRLRQSNERNLQKQIDTAKETAIAQFKATINTKNRQEWINELRHAISQYISQSLQLIPSIETKFATSSDRTAFYEKLVYSKTKIELLVNNEKPEQAELLNAIENLLTSLNKKKDEFNLNEFKDARDKTISVSRKLFDIHWKKIKELK